MGETNEANEPGGANATIGANETNATIGANGARRAQRARGAQKTDRESPASESAKRCAGPGSAAAALAESRRFCVAPMLEWTDRHFRSVARLMTRKALLFTEMVPLGALAVGDRERFLARGDEQGPLALQIGGSDPAQMAIAAQAAQAAGYDEINVNCGCPSPKVQKGAFGAILMREANLVADMVKAAQDAAQLPCTVKNRVGLDKDESYAFLADFVGTVHAKSGNDVFYVHARNAWLHGLSPKENREIPPLRRDAAARLKRDMPDLTVVINGGIGDYGEIDGLLRDFDGVMVGRKAYKDPLFLREVDQRFFGAAEPPVGDDELVGRIRAYVARAIASGKGTQTRHVCRHLLGFFQGEPGSKEWRRILSDPQALAANDPDVVFWAYEPIARARARRAEG